MFAGIVQAAGRIVTTRARSGGLRIAIDPGALDIGDVAVGDSIAVSGCCLTVVEIDGATLGFDVSAETLRCTAGLDRAGGVNLEKALRLGERVGGHLLTGHVDGVGTVTVAEPAGADTGGVLLEIEAPAELARFIATKGSIAVDGISLTVNAVRGRHFSVNLIPHTLAVTTLSTITPGVRVNLEIDIIARYVARLQETESRQEGKWT
jgi:riboflavin synthase